MRSWFLLSALVLGLVVASPSFAAGERAFTLESDVASVDNFASAHHGWYYWKCEGNAIAWDGSPRIVTYGGWAADYAMAARSSTVSCEQQFKQCGTSWSCRAI